MSARTRRSRHRRGPARGVPRVLVVLVAAGVVVGLGAGAVSLGAAQRTAAQADAEHAEAAQAAAADATSRAAETDAAPRAAGQAALAEAAALAEQAAADAAALDAAARDAAAAPAAPALSIDDPASLWVVVNKARPLGEPGYVPADLVSVPVAHTFDPLLRSEASAATVDLFAAASAEAGLALASTSAYRGFSVQERIYAGFVARSGQAFADTTSAREGHSEHQTGLAVDIAASSGRCTLNACFGETAEGRWLASEAWRFGFLLRYPADKAAVTGFAYEPWHFRYVGVNLATTLHDSGVRTLEEHFGLPAAPGYIG